MAVDVGSQIAELLFEDDEVNVPGLGSFSTQYKPATLDKLEGKLRPPLKEVVFEPNSFGRNQKLLELLEHKYGMTATQAEEAVNRFVSGIKSNIEKKEIVTLPSVGILFKDFKNELRFFAEAPAEPLQESVDLPVVDMNTTTPAPKLEEAAPIEKNTLEPQAKLVLPATGRLPLKPSPVIVKLRRRLPVLSTVALLLVGACTFLYFSQSTSSKTEAYKIDPTKLNVKPSKIAVQSGTNPSNTEIAADSPESLLPSENQTGNTADDAIAQENTAEMTITGDETTILPTQKSCTLELGNFNLDKTGELIAFIYNQGWKPFTEKSGDKVMVKALAIYEKKEDLEKSLLSLHNKFKIKPQYSNCSAEQEKVVVK